MQVAPPLNEVPYDEHLSAVETEPPCAALSGLSAIWTLNPGLAPWAVLLDPFGVLGFAPETSYYLTFAEKREYSVQSVQPCNSDSDAVAARRPVSPRRHTRARRFR